VTTQRATRTWSLSYLTASSLAPPQAVAIAAQTGYSHVGLRLAPSMPGGAFQDLMGDANMMRETLACMADTRIGVFDIEVIRIGETFEASQWHHLLEVGAALKARGVLVVADDTDPSRLAQSYAHLCELAAPFALTIDMEFLPWTAIRDANSVLRILDAAGRPANAGILVDALHMARSTSTLADIAALPAGHLHYAQICDGPGKGNFTREEMIHTAVAERQLPGEGSIDLNALFNALPADLPLSVEIPHHVRLPQLGALEWARQALAASRAVLNSLA
jgi:sugar phosphate isomerase/epimerase